MGDAQGIQLLVLLFLLSIVAGAIALAVSPELRADLRDQVARRLAWLAGGAHWLQRWAQTQPGAGCACSLRRAGALLASK
jgi:hypothetical protein